MPGAERPRHDIDVIFLAHGFEPRDLLRAPSGRIAVEKAADHIVGLPRAALPGADFPAFQAVLHGGPFNRGSDEEATDHASTGRASGRERVCQYVEVSVVGGA